MPTTTFPEPKDDHARFVLTLLADSQKELDRIALAQQEALLNSLGAGADEFPVTHESPYGDPFGLVRAYFEDRAISDIISPFSAEQTNSLTTKLAAPWIGQREVLYVDANGGEEEVNKAKVRERVWERTIRSKYTNWSLAVWMAFRDVVVRSRGYLEVCHLTLEEERRVYTYNPIKILVNSILSGFMKALGQSGAGTIRMHSMEKVTLWDGPIIRARPFGTVFRDPSETVLSENSRWVAYKDVMTRAELIAEATRVFGKGSKIRFQEKMLDNCQQSKETAKEGSKPLTKYQRDVAPKGDPSAPYESYEVIVWKGIDPEEDAATRWIYWVVNGVCIGAKQHDGSGSWNNIVELCWDPMTDFATSMSPIMLIRRLQEMDSMLLSNGLDAATWECHPGGFVNTLVVNDIEQVRNMRPTEMVEKMGEGEAMERIQLGGNSMQTLQHAATVRDIGRLATGAIASVVGASPAGANTATEFSGISSGAIGRIDMQQELNADLCLPRLFDLVIADSRDSMTEDAALQDFIGDDGTLGDVTMEYLDGDMDCHPMAARFQVIRQQELAAMKGLLADARIDPYLMGKLKKEELYDDYVYAAAGGPRGWRWAKTAKEMAAGGMPPATLEQTAVANAAMSGGQGGGQPSQPAPASAQPSTEIQTAGNTPGFTGA